MRRLLLVILAFSCGCLAPTGLYAQRTASVALGYSIAQPGVSGPEVRAALALTPRWDATVEAWKGDLEVGCFGLRTEPCPDQSWALGAGLRRNFQEPDRPGRGYIRAAAGYGRMNDGDQGGYLLGALGVELTIGEVLTGGFELRAHGVAVEWLGLGGAFSLGIAL